ncbi:hypothetical protein LTR86_007457 [Recurvomyces mirabilis]|nr:hypothetical protein LTR86_007457 [Recurvomyces mirabilis]
MSDNSSSSGIELPQNGSKTFHGKAVVQPKLFGLGTREGRTTFETESLEEYYKPIDSYEGAHRYDPKFEWTTAEEKRLVRKIDLRICSWVCFMFFALQLDRGNISQALSDDMLGDLKITTNDYNTGQTIFYLTFLFAELPSQLISKKIGPDTASWFRGKNGWFNKREEKIMVNRVLRDDPSKGDMHNRQALDFQGFWLCLKDWHM